MSQPYLSKERAKTLLVEIVEASPPGSKNPREQGSKFGPGLCLYDAPEAKGQRRCIVGEMLHRMGLPKPESGQGITFMVHQYVDKGYMSADTCEWLGKVQGRFDWYEQRKGRYVSHTWRQALKQCRSMGLL